jgi:large subunit ribosomal protein L23
MDLYHIVIRPLVTEKSTHQATRSSATRGGAYSFEVHPEANKTQIKDAVQKLYGVKVLSVRTSNHEGKLRRYRLRWGRTRKTKKAVVVVDPNSHIDLF